MTFQAAAKNRGGQSAIGHATLLSLALVGGLFTLKTWIATDLAQVMKFSSAATAFYEISEQAGGAWLRHLILPVTEFAVTAYVLYEMDNPAKILGAYWIAIGALYYLILSCVLKKPVALEV